jgi:hypothetical protein
LILDADEPDAEMVEFLQRRQEVSRAAGEAVELPNLTQSISRFRAAVMSAFSCGRPSRRPDTATSQ